MPNNSQIIFSVIMPAFNEAAHLVDNVKETISVMDQLGHSYEIILVDDGSKDNTAEVITKIAKEYEPAKAVLLKQNQGKGNALREGFAESSGELIFFLDADLDLHPKQFRMFYDLLEEKKTDVVIGSKRHPETVLNYPLKRRIVSTVYFAIVKILFGLPIKDTQTGMKLFKRAVLTKTFPKILVKKYAFDLEMLVLAHHYGFTIAEAPVVVNYRGKFGHIGVGTIFNIWWDTMAVWYRLRLKKYYDKLDNK